MDTGRCCSLSASLETAQPCVEPCRYQRQSSTLQTPVACPKAAWIPFLATFQQRKRRLATVECLEECTQDTAAKCKTATSLCPDPCSCRIHKQPECRAQNIIGHARPGGGLTNNSPQMQRACHFERGSLQRGHESSRSSVRPCSHLSTHATWNRCAHGSTRNMSWVL
jgi:hypothetical protein